MPGLNDILRTLIGAAFGVLRWSQMVPMIVGWGFVLLALLALLFIGFQEESVGILIWLQEKIASRPGLEAWLSERFQSSAVVSETGGITVTDEVLIPFFLTAWLVLSFVLWVLSAVWHLIRGTQPGQ